MFNDNVEERYGLAIERIKEIAEEPELENQFGKSVYPGYELYVYV